MGQPIFLPQVATRHKTIELGDTNDASEFYMLLVDDLCKDEPALKKIFFGSTRVVVECQHCGFQESSNQELGVISLPCHTGDSLATLLHRAFASETIDSKCDKCHKIGASKSFQITKLPAMLTMVQNETRHRTQVESILGIVRGGRKHKYELVGAVIHSANHYICVVKNNDKFYACNDEHIAEVDRPALLKAASMGSMLFFHKM